MANVRAPAVAGLFYPDEQAVLRQDVQRMLDQADHPQTSRPKAIIVPHAGYIYSGPTAAQAYKLLQPFADKYRHVVLLGPSHRVGFTGIATCSAEFYETPLGSIPLNLSLTKKALACPLVECLDQAHLMEHSLEVHLPFLQTVLDEFTLTPLVVGDCDAVSCAEVINQLWGDQDTLFVISSDLSHFLDYDSANAIDRRTCHAIESFNGEAISYDQACGRNPIKGLLKASEQHPLKIETLHLCNSGDTAGDKNRVVGYGAWALWEASEGN